MKTAPPPPRRMSERGRPQPSAPPWWMQTVLAIFLLAGHFSADWLFPKTLNAEATHPGWEDATGQWAATLQLTPGPHTLMATAEHPSGWVSESASSTFTVTGTAQGMTQTFDAMGNVLSRTWSGGKTQAFTWDAFCRLVKVVQTGAEPFVWTAAYDGLGRRFRTVYTPSGGSPFTVSSSFDPEAEFLEVLVNVNGKQHQRVNGPDVNGTFGSLNGTGGLETVILPGGTEGVISDLSGHVLAAVKSDHTVKWNPAKVASYGPAPNAPPQWLETGASLVEATSWRTRRADPTGLINLGARHYDPTCGLFVSADPLGHGFSWSLYDFASGDPVNLFDADGRVASGFASGVAGSFSAGASNSDMFHMAAMAGGMFGGYYMGLAEGGRNVSGYTALHYNLKYYDGDLYQALNMTYNPVAIGSIKYAEAFDGMGYSHSNSGRDLDVSERLMAFGEGTLAWSVVAGPLEAAAMNGIRATAAAKTGGQTTVLGENMMQRVIPYAEQTGGRTLPFGTTAERWAQMTPQQRWKLNDGALRARINEGDSFKYIGQDPFRNPLQRQQFDLTGSELLRLNERGIPYQTVSPQAVQSVIGRP